MLSPAELARHWRTLRECEQTGVKPRVFRELLEHIAALENEVDQWRAEHPAVQP